MAADLADGLEASGVTYAALDLDWLALTNASGSTRADEHFMMLVNLKAIVTNFLDAGATYFVLARSVRDRHELTSLAAAIGMPLRSPSNSSFRTRRSVDPSSPTYLPIPGTR